MQGKLSRYKKVILSCLCVLTVSISVCSFSLESKASVVDEYYLDYAEPATGTNQGYISYVFQERSTGELFVETFFWTSWAFTEDGKEIPSFCSVNQTQYEVFFVPWANTDVVVNGAVSLTKIDRNGVFIPYPVSTGASSKASYSWYIAGYDLVGYKYGGNALVKAVPQGYKFALYFSEDGSAQQLMYLYGLIQSSQDISNRQYNELIAIYNNTNTTNEKLENVKTYLSQIRGDLSDISEQLDEILGEEKKQTSWLEKIWNSLQEFLGKKPNDEATAPVDPEDNLGSIEESEEILLPDTSEAEASLNVQLNSGFGVLTWLVDSFAKLDPGVFSMYLTMLTFGVVALLLGR